MKFLLFYLRKIVNFQLNCIRHETKNQRPIYNWIGSESSFALKNFKLRQNITRDIQPQRHKNQFMELLRIQ